MLRLHPARKTYSAEIKHRTFGRVHLHLKTKVKSVAITRHAALQQLLDAGEPVKDIVAALRARKITIQAVEECVRAKRPFDTLRPSTWPTLGDAIREFVEAQRAHENIAANTVQGTENALKPAREHFGADTPVETLTHEDVAGYRDALRARDLEPNTVHLYLIKLGALFNWLQRRETRRAQQQRRTPAVLFSPVDRDEHLPQKQQTRHRFLLEPEVERLLVAAPASIKAAIALGVFAGLRLGEICMLRPGFDVDRERGVLFIQAREGWEPKYGRNRDVPISSALEPFLRAHLDALPPDAPYVFPGRSEGTPMAVTTLGGIFRQVVSDAELVRGRKDPEGVTFHTLRHTFASWLVMAGADLFTIARLMGHTSTTQVEQTYGHLSPQHRLATVEMLSTRWLSRPAQNATRPSTEPDGRAQDTTGDTTNVAD
jgi:integrase